MTYNMLTADDASLETGSESWYSSSTTLTRSTEQAYHGSYALKSVSTSGGNNTITSSNSGTSATPVAPSTQYTVSMRIWRSPGATETGARIFAYWYTAAGTECAGNPAESTNSSPLASTWVLTEGQLTSPSDAAFVRLALQVSGTTTNDVYYWDAIGLWEGSSGTWALPNNLLSANQSWLESGSISSTVDWYTYGATPSASTTVAHNGAYSLKLVDTASGYFRIPSENPIPVTAGREYTMQARFRKDAAAGSISAAFAIYWYDSGMGSLSTWTDPSSTPMSSSAWTLKSHTTTAPASAAYAVAKYSPSGVQVGEITYWDDMAFYAEPAVTQIAYSRHLIIG